MANTNPPIKNQAFTIVISLDSFANPGSKQLNPTLAAGDVKVRIDDASYTNAGTLPVADGAGKSGVLLSLSATEMNNDIVFVQFVDQTSPKEWADFTLTIQTVAGVWNVGKTGYALSAAGVQAIWDALTSALTAVGSIGKLLVDNINATISSRSTYAGADTAGTTTLLARVPGTVQPQTGDSYARLGAPAGASVSADVAAIKTVVDAVKAKTDQLVFTIANKVDAAITNAASFAQAAADLVWGTATRALTDKAGFSLTAAYDPAKTAAQAGDAMDLVADAVDSSAVAASAVTEIQNGLATAANQVTINNNVLAVGTVLGTPAGASVSADIAAINAKTTNLPASPAAVGDIPTAAQNADKLLGRSLAAGADGGRTVQDALRVLRNKRSIAAGVLTVTQEDDATAAWTATVATAASDPVQSIDPA